MLLANFSMFCTIPFEVFSTAVAMLFANSAPGTAAGVGDWVGALTFGL